jgi:hypothetical protein
MQASGAMSSQEWTQYIDRSANVKPSISGIDICLAGTLAVRTDHFHAQLVHFTKSSASIHVQSFLCVVSVRYHFS